MTTAHFTRVFCLCWLLVLGTTAVQSTHTETSGQGQTADPFFVYGLVNRMALMEATLAHLQTENAQLRTDVQTLKNEKGGHGATTTTTTTAVAFSVRNPANDLPSVGETLVLNQVILNQGQGYSPATGKFTAPVTGSYYFSAFAVTGFYSGVHANLWLKTNSASAASIAAKTSGYLLFLVAHNDGERHSGSLQTALHLEKGEQVWLLSMDPKNRFKGGVYTGFSGFLISAD